MDRQPPTTAATEPRLGEHLALLGTLPISVAAAGWLMFAMAATDSNARLQIIGCSVFLAMALALVVLQYGANVLRDRSSRFVTGWRRWGGVAIFVVCASPIALRHGTGQEVFDESRGFTFIVASLWGLWFLFALMVLMIEHLRKRRTAAS